MIVHEDEESEVSDLSEAETWFTVYEEDEKEVMRKHWQKKSKIEFLICKEFFNKFIAVFHI